MERRNLTLPSNQCGQEPGKWRPRFLIRNGMDYPNRQIVGTVGRRHTRHGYPQRPRLNQMVAMVDTGGPAVNPIEARSQTDEAGKQPPALTGVG